MRTKVIAFTRGGPWFRNRPRVTVAVAALTAAVIFALLLAAPDAADSIGLLFTFPIALLAVAFGLRAGLLSGLAGVALVALAMAVDGVDLPPIGWITRVIPMLLLGGLLGDAMDRMERAEREQLRLQHMADRQRDAIEINDTFVQGLAAAKWALESGDTERGLAIVTDTLHSGQKLVTELIRESQLTQTWTGQALQN